MARKAAAGAAQAAAGAQALSFSDIQHAQAEPVNLQGGGPLSALLALFRPGLSAPTAYYAILAAAVACDGLTTPEESQELAALAARTKTLSKLGPDGLAKTRDWVAGRLERAKLGQLIEHAGRSLPKKMRMAAFANACDLVFADRVVLASERDFLKRLIDIMGLDKKDAEEMLWAIRAKNMH